MRTRKGRRFKESRVSNATLVRARPRARPPKHGYRFIREFIANPFTVGAIAPSGERLCRKMVEGIDLASARTVAEFGPGTGACTDAILPLIPPPCRFLAVELN